MAATALVASTVVWGADPAMAAPVWTPQYSPLPKHVNAVDMVDATVGYLAGDGGAVWKTLDGGVTFSALSTPTTRNLFGLDFVDATTGYVVGDNGVLLKTTNGGTTWIQQTHPGGTARLTGVDFPADATTGTVVGLGPTLMTTSDGGATWVLRSAVTTQLEAVDFPVDNTTGYAVGLGGRVVKTTNGGASWFGQLSPTTQDLFGVDFRPDGLTGYAVGKGGVIFKTTDGALTWAAQISGVTEDLYSVHFPIDAGTGYAVGRNGTILETTDGGSTWSQQAHPGGTAHLNGVRFTSATDGTVVGVGPTILITTDGGTSWSLRSGVTNQLEAVDFPVDNTTGYTVGLGGRVMKTTNGGVSWGALLSPTTQDLFGVDFLPDGVTGYAVGKGGVIFKTTDGALTWVAQPSGVTQDLHSVHFPIDATTGYVTGRDGTILKTTDGGVTWSPQVSGVSDHLYATNFPIDATTGFAVGESGTILTTSDGGATWGSQVSGVTKHLEAVHFPTGLSTGYAGGRDGTILKTTDGGASWVAQTSGVTKHIYGLGFVDDTTGHVVGQDGTILVTSDGGASWSPETAPTTDDLFGVVFPVDGTTGFAVGQNAVTPRTTDGGATWSNPLVATTNDLEAVHYPSAGVGYATGRNGAIVKTNDGGQSWTAQVSGTTDDLFGVSFVDDATGYAIGQSGAILATTDGGASWSPQAAPSAADLFGVVFPVDGTTGYAVGQNGATPRTTDSGSTWVAPPVAAVQDHFAVHYPSASIGYVTGKSGEIIKTTDGGVTWTVQASGTTDDLFGVSFVDDTTGYAVGKGGTILKTTDGGSSWAPQTSPTTENLTGVSFPAGSSGGWAVGAKGTVLNTLDGGATWNLAANISGGANLNGLDFPVDATMGVIGGDGPVVMRTPNGGSNWSASFDVIEDLHGVSFPVNELVGYAVGAGGRLLKTTDGGGTWTPLPTLVFLDLFDVHFVDNSTGYAVGKSSTIVKTVDGGLTWAAQTSPVTDDLLGVHFPVDATTGYAAGKSGTILKTTDGGSTWIEQTSPTANDLFSVHFRNNSRGVAVGKGGTALTTFDGGSTWVLRATGVGGDLDDVVFASPSSDTVYVAGNAGVVIKSTDGGSSWSSLTSGTTENLNGVDFLDASTGYVAGNKGVVLHTTDGGASWTPVPVLSTSELSAVAFPVDSTTGYVVGKKGTIAATTDSGATWAFQALASDKLFGVSFPVGATIGYAAGKRGTILKTTNGGASWLGLPGGSTVDLYDIQFPIDVTTGWTVGKDGLIRKTATGGNSWATQPSGSVEDLLALDFWDNTKGWAVGKKGVIVATVDSGTTWGVQASGTTKDLQSVHFPGDALTGYAAGKDGTILKTTDGGTSWALQTTPTTEDLFGIHFPDVLTGYAVGKNATILETTNGGSTWSTLVPPSGDTFLDVHFVDALTGWVVDAKGLILGTTDGGSSWFPEASGTTDALHAIDFGNPIQGFAVGNGPLIIARDDPAVNIPPSGDPIADQTVDEGETVSLTATATDPNGDGLTWSQDSGPGAVDAAGNYSWTTTEADGPGVYAVVLRVTDDGTPNLADTVSFDVTVADVNEAPTDVSLAPATVAENLPVGTVVGTLSTVDPDPGDTHTYSLVAGAGDTHNGLFAIVGDELRTAAALDYEVLGTPLSIRVQTQDSGAGNLTYQEALAVVVTDANDAPVAVDDDPANGVHYSVPRGGTLVIGPTHGFDSSWGTTGAGPGQFAKPEGLAVDLSGNVVVVDGNNHRVQVFHTDGTFVRQWGSFGTGTSQFDKPTGVSVNGTGRVYVADSNNHRVQVFEPDGTFLAEWGSFGASPGQFNKPEGITIAAGGAIYVADGGNNRIQEFDASGTFVRQWGTAGSGPGQFSKPTGVAVDAAGNVYVADSGNNRIQRFNSSGTFVAQWGTLGSAPGQLDKPNDLAVDGSGSVYVADASNNRIQKFDSAGTYLAGWGSFGTGAGQFDAPRGVIVDGAGTVFVADSNNDRIQRFTAAGSILANDSDPDSDPFTVFDEDGATPGIQPSSSPTNGTLSLNGDGTFTYTHNGSATSSDSFDYRATDGSLQSNPGTVLITVTTNGVATNGPPTDIALIPSSVAENVPVGTVVGTLSTTDPDAWDTHTYSLVAGAGDTHNGLFTLAGDELRTAAPLDYEALGSPLSIRVQTQDSGTGNLTFQKALAVTLNDQNEVPTAFDDAAGAAEDGVVVINVKANDADPEDGIPAGPATVVADPAHGTAVANAGGQGTITYTPDPDFSGTDQFTYTIDDSGSATSNTAIVVVTVAGSDDPPLAADDGPYELLEDGSLAIAAHDFQYDLEWGSAGNGNGQFTGPRGVAVAPDGSVYVADTANDRIQKFDATGTYLLQWGTSGTGNGQFDTPFGVAVADDGTVYVTDGFNDRIQYFDPNGTYLGQFGGSGAGDGQFNSPRTLDIGPDGNLYVTDTYNYRIQVFTPAGVYLRKWGSFGTGNGQFDAPRGLAVSDLGIVYVADSFNDRVQRFDSFGNYLGQWGTVGTGSGQFDFPRAIDLDPAGNVYVADSFNNRIQVFDGSGSYLSEFGTAGSGPGQFTNTYGISFGPGNLLYVVDIGNNRIERFAIRGILFNDTDPDLPADALTASVSTDVSNGTLVLNPDGSFTYDPDPDFFGPDSFVYQVCDTTPTCDTATVFIMVDGVNDAPSFTPGSNVVVFEDNGPATIPGWATAIIPGPVNESAQTVTFNVTGNTNPGLFAVGPAVDGTTGDLTFTPAGNANGVASITIEAQDDGGTPNGGVDTSGSSVFTISVGAVNDAPSFNSGGNVVVLEDSGGYSAPWATAVSPGPADESGQAVTFAVTGNTNPGLFAGAPAVDSAGTLTFTPAAEAFGSADITLEARDDGGTANGGNDTSAPVVFTITLDPVNDAPAFTAGGNIGLDEDDGPTTVAGWASGMSPGPANEAAQTLTFNVTGNTNPGLFSVQPALDPVSGDLTFTPAADAFGSATITIELQDDGGTANGGVDTSAPVNFTITVNPRNDAPTFTPGGTVTVNEDSGAYDVGWASSMSPGPANETGQSLTFKITGNTNPGLFAVAPMVDATTGNLTFTPAADATGTADITIELQDDGGTANGGVDTSAPVMFTINLDPVNDAPTFTPGGNVSVVEDSGAYAAPWASSISPGPANEAGQNVSLNIRGNTNPGLFSAGPTVDGAGTLTFTPAANANGVASITIEAQDDGGTANGGNDTSAPVMFTISIGQVNDPPTLDPIGNQAIDEGTLLSFTATASDADDVPPNALTFSLSGAVPAGASITPGGDFTWTPSEADGPGVFTFDVVVTETDGSPTNLSDSETITVTVNEADSPPVLDPVGDRTVDEGSFLSFTVTSSDPDTPSTRSYSLEDGPGSVPAGAAIDSALGLFGWATTEADGPGVYTFDVVVTDNTGLEDRETISVTVNELNVPPVLDPIGDQSGDELTLISFTATASDADQPANALTFSLVGEPAGAAITAGGDFTWTPSEAQGPGSYTFDVLVADGGSPPGSDSETITITIAEVGSAPVLDPIGDITVDETDLVAVTITASDPDLPAESLSYVLVSGPAGATLDPVTRAFLWVPTESQGPGSYEVVVRVEDPTGLAAVGGFTVTVNDVNEAPVIIDPGAQTTGELLTVNLPLVAIDDDEPANTLTWTAAGLPAGLAINPATGVISGTVQLGAATASPYTVTITVTDDGAPPAEATVTVPWVVLVNRPPTAAPDLYNVEPGGTLAVAGPGVMANDGDPDGDVLAAAVVVPPVHGSLALNPNGSFTYTHGGADSPEDVFVYQVDDGRGGQALATVKLVIAELNLPPVLVTDVLVVPEDQSGVINPLANDSDPNGDVLTLLEFIQPSVGLLSTAGPGLLSYTPPPNFFGETTATYVATDGKGAITTGTLSLIVEPVNDLPTGGLDSLRLGSYAATVIDVLANDRDVDGDVLRVLEVLSASFGTVILNPDQTISYRPQRGFVGTDTFSYVLADGAGGTDMVLVQLEISEQTLAAALEAGEAIGSPTLGFQAPPSDLTDGPPASVLSLGQGVTLMVSAFFQSLDALRLPILFLGLALGSAFVIGSFTEVPLLLAARRRRFYAVVNLDREHRLPVYEQPDDQTAALFFYEPTAAGFRSLDKPVVRGGTEWIPVESPNGAGWVEASHLTEAVDLQYFLDDDRPVEVLRRLAGDLKAAKNAAALFSERGLAVALTNRPAMYPSWAVRDALAPTTTTPLGLELYETVLEPLGRALDEAVDLDSRAGHSQTALIPVELWNFQYLAVTAEGHPPWLVYFEYVKDKPLIVGIGVDV